MKDKNFIKNFNDKCLLRRDKQQKISNCIAIGGMISAGKTTVCEELVKKYNFTFIPELSNDESDLMNVLLKKMYEREIIANSVCQLQFILGRYEKYKSSNLEVKPNEILVFDRTIFEDRLFAFHNMLDEPSVYEYYEKLWRDKVHELLYNVGTPKLYIILTLDWSLFKKRIYQRNRKIEIDNFKLNETYFRLLNETYLPYLKNICNAYSIPYIIINASLPLKEKIKIIDKELKELKIIK